MLKTCTINKLLKYFYNNESFEKYIGIINSSEISQNNICKHHVIPVSVYRIEKSLKSRNDALFYANADPNNFIVNLTYSSHILAHYYLCLCAKEDSLKYACECAFFWMLSGDNKNKILPKEIELIETLPQYEVIYKNWLKQNSIIHKNMKTTKGKICIYNKETNRKKYIFANELDTYINLGWIKGGIPHTAEEKIKIGKNSQKCLTGRKVSENSNIKRRETMLKLSADENSNYRKSRQIMSEKFKNKKRDPKIFEKSKLTRQQKNNGAYASENWKILMSEKLKGRTSSSKGKIGIINDDGVRKFISKENINEYLDLGWHICTKSKYYKENNSNE